MAKKVENTVKQAKSRVEYIQPYQWKKGQSGNPKGRPKGKTMKDYAREMLEKMTEEERQDFLHGLPKEIIWKMAEGNPAQDVTSGGEKIIQVPIYGGKSVQGHDGDQESLSSK